MKRLLIVSVLSLSLNATVLPKKTDSTPKKSPAKQITLTNNIEKSMLRYGGIYSPDSFSITVNGIPLKPKESLQVPADKPFTVRYHYNFARGYKKGSKERSFEPEQEASHSEITFSWKDESRVMATHAKGGKLKEIE